MSSGSRFSAPSVIAREKYRQGALVPADAAALITRDGMMTSPILHSPSGRGPSPVHGSTGPSSWSNGPSACPTSRTSAAVPARTMVGLVGVVAKPVRNTSARAATRRRPAGATAAVSADLITREESLELGREIRARHRTRPPVEPQPRERLPRPYSISPPAGEMLKAQGGERGRCGATSIRYDEAAYEKERH